MKIEKSTNLFNRILYSYEKKELSLKFNRESRFSDQEDKKLPTYGNKYLGVISVDEAKKIMEKEKTYGP